MLSSGRLPNFLNLFSGFGLQPPPPPTPSYAPPGAAYATFPGLEGTWRVYRNNVPVGDLSFFSEWGELKGSFKFIEVPRELLDQFSFYGNWEVVFYGDLPLYGISIDWEKNKIKFRFYTAPASTIPELKSISSDQTLFLFQVECSVIGSQLIGTFKVYRSLEPIEVPDPARTEFIDSYPGEPKSLHTIGPPSYKRQWIHYPERYSRQIYDNGSYTKVYPSSGMLFAFNAIKVSTPVFVPSLVVVRSPTPGQTMEITVPVVTAPQQEAPTGVTSTAPISAPAPVTTPAQVTDSSEVQISTPVSDTGEELKMASIPGIDFLSKTVSIAGMEFPIWMIAAGVFLVLLTKRETRKT